MKENKDIVSRTIVQTSRHKPTAEHIEALMINAPGWEYAHFNDEEILNFFQDNPIPGFELIEQKFRSIKRGEHRADLFRYYYIYLNGGFFIDLDFELSHDINDVVKNYDFVLSSIDNTSEAVLNDTKRARAFNGYFYASRNHPIVLQALSHLYNLELHNLGPENGEWDSRYHVVCEFLYNLIASYPDKENIKVYSFIDGPDGGFIFNGLQKLGQHKGSAKEGIPYTVPKLPNQDSGFNKKDYMLMFCEDILSQNFNSGIQRYTRKLAKTLLESGVKLIPVTRGTESAFKIPDQTGLETFSNFGGPGLNLWPKEIFSQSLSDLMSLATHMINPELNRFWNDGELEKMILNVRGLGIKYVSIFHDAIPAKMTDVYSNYNAENFLKFMKDLSASDIIISVSESSKVDYESFTNDYINKSLKKISLLLPHNINPDKMPEPKVNSTNDIKILCVATFDERKNHLGLIRSFGYAKNKLKDSEYTIDLSIIASYECSDSLLQAEIYKEAEAAGVKIRINVTEEELAQSYADADFSVYPSFYEGFGLPVAESLSFNTPVICSNTSSMAELAQSLDHKGIKTFTPSDTQQLAQLIIELSTNPDLRCEMVNQISDIKPISWSDYTESLLKSV